MRTAGKQTAATDKAKKQAVNILACQ